MYGASQRELTSGTNRWPIKLSNWQRLVKVPLPSFFLILEFDVQLDLHQPQRADPAHVDKAWVTTVLRELRQLPPESAIHRKSLESTKWTEADRLESMNGASFREAVRHHIGNQYEYTINKKRWLETVGYENGRYSFSVRMSADTEDELMSRLVDVAIRTALRSFRWLD